MHPLKQAPGTKWVPTLNGSVWLLATCCLSLLLSCKAQTPPANEATRVVTGAEQLPEVIRLIAGRRVALVANPTSLVGKTPLADTLLAMGVDLRKVFAPEHGFRGSQQAGATVNDTVDVKTGLRVISLYGNNKKPSPASLQDVDVVVFDIQDVGVRFYTYLSTLHYVMEACAETDRALVVLDRPNPNGAFIDGPVLEPAYQSFVGLDPVPILYGMTIGEYARMLNGEGWLHNREQCRLSVVALKHWTHEDGYSLPVAPSPNLPDDQAIRLYPSLCLFEGTVISVGRGTPFPFECIGHPDLSGMPFSFVPGSIEGKAVHPPYEGQQCHGLDLRQDTVTRGLSLRYLIDMYHAYNDPASFFTSYFERLAGTAKLREEIQAGHSGEAIRAGWQPALNAFRAVRQKYLLYK